MAIVVACVGQKGGSGKSLIARTILAESTRLKRKSVLVDLDVGQHTADDWNKAREHNKLKPELSVEVIDPDEETDFRLPELSATFDLIILDAPGFSDDMTLRIAAVADLIVLPTAPSTDDLRPTMRLVHELTRAQIPNDRIVIVLNRIRTEAEAKFAESYLVQGGLAAFPRSLPDQPIYRKAANGGQAPSEVSSPDPQEKARELVAALLGHVDDVVKRPKATTQKVKPKRFTLEDGEQW